MSVRTVQAIRSVAVTILTFLFGAATARAQYPTLDLDLPGRAVARRVSRVTKIPAGEKATYAKLDGPGCIRHIWCTNARDDGKSRDVVIRIFFDDSPAPHVEAPLGDFFGVMHGKAWYPIDTPFLSVQAKSGYNCYFAMPFAKSARVEFEAGPTDQGLYCQIDWHQYPDEPLREPRRFCARWRREFPTQRYDEDYLMLDADGPGRLVGFVYGVRLIDNVDRWSHGGADNIYIDGDGEQPSYLRGIGGEDTFGTSFGGSLHTPRTHLNAEMAYYEQVDDGAARPSKEIVGYRWFINDSIEFRKSLHLRFGCLSNDICSTVYWYQTGAPRPFFKLPGFEHFAAGRDSKEIPRGTFDLPLPDSGSWRVSPAGDESLLSGALGQRLNGGAPLPADWIKRPSLHGFVDLGHVHRPEKRGAGVFHEGAASARAIFNAPRDLEATLRIGWDDRLVLRVNDRPAVDLGHRDNFGHRELRVPLKKGGNLVEVTLGNTRNYNHGGWAFSLRATTADGEVLLPRGE